MKALQRMLLLLDPSLERTPAVERSIALARAANAQLWLALHDRGPRLGPLGLIDRPWARRVEGLMRDQLSERLRDLRHALLSEGVPEVQVIDDRNRLTAKRVADDVTHHRIDLVIKSVGRPSAQRKRVLLPFDWELLRSCPVPLWMAGAHDTARPKQMIVAAVDPVHPEHGAGALNDRILDTANWLQARGPSELRVLSAFAGIPPGLQALDPFPVAIGLPDAELHEQLRTDHQRALQALVAAHALPAETAMVLNGDPSTSLLDTVTRLQPDVLVIGSLHRRGLDRLFIGSTAERVIGEVACDVLVVPAPAARGRPAVRKPVVAD